jgi:hypothetical protein
MKSVICENSTIVAGGVIETTYRGGSNFKLETAGKLDPTG